MYSFTVGVNTDSTEIILYLSLNIRDYTMSVSKYNGF